MDLISPGEKARAAGEDAAWFLRQHVVWPVEDVYDRLGPRGTVGVFGGGGVAIAGVVAALLIASPGSGSSAGTTEALAAASSAAAPRAVAAPSATPKKAAKPASPTLHGAPPSFSAAKNVKAGVGDGKAVAGGAAGEVTPAPRGTTASDAPAATAKIGATPAATASAAQADDRATAGTEGEATELLSGPPAPKAAKRVARRFAQAFVVYETGGVDTKVRSAFGHTATKQLSKSLLHRPPRQPADVKVPQAKVVNVVAGPSEDGLYSVSVSLLRVGVTSELRLEMEQGPDKKWQVTNVLG
jgi:hypothetical protein